MMTHVYLLLWIFIGSNEHLWVYFFSMVSYICIYISQWWYGLFSPNVNNVVNLIIWYNKYSTVLATVVRIESNRIESNRRWIWHDTNAGDCFTPLQVLMYYIYTIQYILLLLYWRIFWRWGEFFCASKGGTASSAPSPLSIYCTVTPFKKNLWQNGKRQTHTHSGINSGAPSRSQQPTATRTEQNRLAAQRSGQQGKKSKHTL